MFELSRDSTVALVDQIAERVTGLIEQGQLSPGARLPSIRKLAKLVRATDYGIGDSRQLGAQFNVSFAPRR